ncbi:MAG TPA: hypothetical protein VJ672_11200 [Gemmatimonadaceae bacterium]|nr:hypothetical protein [Gemmatimonadaceae bacterium]
MAAAPRKVTHVLLAVVIAAAMAVPSMLGAQRGALVSCDGQPIREVEVVTRPPYTQSSERFWIAPIRFLNSIHVTTKPSVIRRYLLLQRGDACTERRRSESERLLRAQPYIARASIRSVDAGDGGVILLVETTDELTPVIDGSVKSESPYVTAVRIGEGNLLGSGTYVAAEWGSNEIRDTYGARLVDYQAFGKPWIMDLSAVRRDAGRSSWRVLLEHPFYTDEQRVAWRASALESNRLFTFYRGTEEPVLLGLEREFFDIGGILRIGEPGRLSLFGVSFSRETDATRVPPVPDDTVDYDALLARFDRRENGRVNALWGLRNIYYRRVSSFDALTATQDVPLGFQLGTLVGRGLSVFGASDDDLLVAADVYGALGNSWLMAAARLRGEARNNYDADRWDGIVTSSRLDAYWRATGHHTVQATFDWSGSWRQRVPLQLTLGDRYGGVRGYVRSRDAGAQRTVLRLEDRWYLGQVRGQADIGLAFFADAGRLRAGDAPFGTSTPVRVGVGIGFLAAVPPGSRRTLRMDIAYPVSNDPHAGWEIRLGVVNVARTRWREPDDVRLGRESSVPTNMFGRP